ncbi:InlB B-repeat-containing protein [Culicoidibacter larvae]|uniref:LPXTG cell wall anchor domain-containing protein n=1 Tax=Culicoidibacter larvae TaxID=2579976 RepID=A0A5R8QDL6_9FIRM|nr:InlB B-repeat-containing protein [Culicoidibacter larvae]TLG74356.1 LPXTG cell wall anchor domain-containing protein [Culicoidibacter larvae]
MKKFFGVLLSVVLLSATFQFAVHADTSVEANTPQELKSFAESATEDTTITLGSGFPDSLSATVSIAIAHNYNITILGNDINLQPMATNVRHLNINNTGSGTVTIDGITFLGSNTVAGDTVAVGAAGGGLTLGVGHFIVQNSMFSKINGSALNGTGGVNRYLEINNSTFEFNTNTGAGGALNFDGGNNDLTVNNSTFYKNKSDALGYSGGAIGLKNGKNLTINNSVFTGNTSKHLGGAIAFHFPQANSTFSIDNSYFEDNATVNPNNGAYGPWADGGAIGVYSDNVNIAFSLTNSTFNANSSYDDGGALMLQNYGATSTNIITNNTFSENVGNGLGISAAPKYDAPGGAIQFSKSANATLESNTFVKNMASGVNTEAGNFGNARGGAIGFHYDTGAVKVYPTLNMKNNLLFGNYVTDSSNQPVASDYANITISTLYDGTSGGVLNNLGGNIGIDDGIVLPSMSSESVFGLAIAEVALSTNQSNVSAGNNNATTNGYFYAQIPTIAIMPAGVPTDNPVAGKGVATSITKDQRGFTRNISTPDIGAVENVAINFDGNNGNWNTMPTHNYDGVTYYSGTEPTNIYKVTGSGNEIEVLSSQYLTHPSGYQFIGWNTEADGGGSSYTPGDQIALAGNMTLYAQWESVETSTENNSTGNNSSSNNSSDNNSELPITGQNTMFITAIGIILIAGSIYIIKRRSSK